jgi:hypothetical protein
VQSFSINIVKTKSKKEILRNREKNVKKMAKIIKDKNQVNIGNPRPNKKWNKSKLKSLNDLKKNIKRNKVKDHQNKIKH